MAYPSLGPMQGASINRTPASGEKHYAVPMTAALVRKLAATSPEADRKLREHAPGAFVGEPVQFIDNEDGWIQEMVAADGNSVIGIEAVGPHKGRGLHLDSRYTWEIVTGPLGIGKTLIARRVL